MKADCFLVDLVIQRDHQQELIDLIFQPSSYEFQIIKFNIQEKVRTKNKGHTEHISPPQGGENPSSRMTPSKKKTLKPKEVSLETSNKEETPKLELPNDLMKKMILVTPPFQTSLYPV